MSNLLPALVTVLAVLIVVGLYVRALRTYPDWSDE
jgi:hypothetical protein